MHDISLVYVIDDCDSVTVVMMRWCALAECLVGGACWYLPHNAQSSME